MLVVVAEPGTPPGLAGRVRAALPGVLDAAAQPDEVVGQPDPPVAGRPRKIDRVAVRERVRCGSR